MTTDNIIEKKITPKIPLTAEEKKLLALVDENEEKIAELLSELVKIESLNYSEFQYHNINKIFDLNIIFPVFNFKKDGLIFGEI